MILGPLSPSLPPVDIFLSTDPLFWLNRIDQGTVGTRGPGGEPPRPALLPQGDKEGGPGPPGPELKAKGGEFSQADMGRFEGAGGGKAWRPVHQEELLPRSTDAAGEHGAHRKNDQVR